MKILYGVQGTGNGHIARARVLGNALRRKAGVEVDFLFSGRNADQYFSMEDFGGYKTRRGLTFITGNGRVRYLKTAAHNSLIKLSQEINSLDLSCYDLVVNDFEPVSAWAAKQQQRPCIGISHQNAFRYSVPLKGANWLDKSMLRYFAPADYHIGLHWYHFNQPILPPIVYRNGHAVSQEAFVLVYLPFESLSDIRYLVNRFSQYQFVCFHPDIHHKHVLENVEYQPLSHSLFQSYLHRCVGVMANGGFELPSEALSLGKKLLLKPLSGQFEQQSNVATLDSLGLASVMDTLDIAKTRAWLRDKQAESVSYPDVASAIADWIVRGNWGSHEELSHSLWDKVDFPSYASHL